MKFRFRADVVPIKGDQSNLLLLVTEEKVRVLNDSLSVELAMRLVGSRESDPELSALLEEWLSLGLVVPATEEAGVEAAFWSSDGLRSSPSGTREVEILPLDPRGAEGLAVALASVGFAVRQDGLLLAAVDEYMDTRLRELDVACRASGRPWMPVKLVGHTIWAGPLFAHDPNQPCFSCMAAGIRMNRWLQCLLWGHGLDSAPPQYSVAMLPTTLTMAAGVIAQILGAWVRGSRRFPLADRIHTLDTRSMELRTHRVTRRPECPECGSGRPLTVPAAVEEFRRFVSPITGLIPKVEIAGRGGGLFHARADVIQPLPIGDARPLIKPNLAIGKGFTAEAAEIGCIAEAVERYSIAFQGNEPRVRARVSDEDHLRRVDLTTLMQISPAQYAARERWAHLDDPRQWIPQPYREDQELEWSPLRSLRDGETWHVPTAYCYFGYPEKEQCRPDTNGCAAGQSHDEATTKALCELIERDAAAIWWYNRLRRPALKLTTLREPEPLLIVREFERVKRRVQVLDLTTDIGVPVYAAVTVTAEGGEPYLGLGCSPDPERAVHQALAEMSQVWFWMKGGAERDALWREWLTQANLETEAYLDGRGEVPLRGAPETESPLGSCVDRLAECGLDPLVLDLTRSETGLPVVRAIVPGLRHFWPRFGPGRLFDVPVRMGWATEPCREEDLNPTPCLL
jgi:bacteriocin biosynthesis cyclodehydratase domain-containing protein